MIPTLIYCAGGNRRFAEIAVRHGYQYGAQLPSTIYLAPYFTDQNWKKPNRERYMKTLEDNRPTLATVLDWEREEQFDEVMNWAEEAAQYVSEAIIIIPKVIGGIKRLPRLVGGKSVRLGYSASTQFSSTPVYLSEFKGWSVHCLGGSVATQMRVAREVDCLSADGNYAQRAARQYGQVYSPSIIDNKKRSWPRLSRFCGYRGIDSQYYAFELSSIAIPMAWKGHRGTDIYDAQLAKLDELGIAPEKRQLTLIA